MEKIIKELIQKFDKIKKGGLYKSQRRGTTGIGYTFEKLLGKEEDYSYAPDYKGIEIKTKLGYSKCPVTLFSLVPKSRYKNTIERIVKSYGYLDNDYNQFKVLRCRASSIERNYVNNKYLFKLYVDWSAKKVKLLIFNKKGNIISGGIHWTFDDLRERLCTKLKYMALVIGYPYRFQGVTYYKYFNITFYKLKSYEAFLRLIEKGNISVVFNIGIYKNKEKLGAIYDHGTSFKLSTKNIPKLFDKISLKKENLSK